MGPRNAGNVMKKPTNSKKTILRMIKDFKKEMGLIIFVVILSILSAVLNVYSPILLQDIFNSVSEIFKMEGNVITISWNIFYQKFGIIIGVYIVSAILQWLSQYIAASIGARYAYEMRDRVQKKLDKLPLSYFDKTSYGDTLSIGTNDVDNISRNLQTIITQLFAGIALFLGSLIAMLVTDWRLALVALVSLPLTLIIVVLISKFSGKQFTTYRNELGVLNGKIEEDYAGYMIIKLFNKEKDIEQDFDESNEKMAKADGNSQFLSGLIFPTTIFINNLAYVGVAVLAGIISDAGTMIVFFLFLRLFSSPFQQLGQIASTIQSVIASGERIYVLLDQKEEDPDKEKSITDESKIKGDFKFDNVFFQYSEDKPLIENWTLDVKAGDTVAIVGPTGAGKTTIVNLIMRFYEINSVHNKEEVLNEELHIINEIAETLKLPKKKLEDLKYDDKQTLDKAIEKAKLEIQDYYIKATANSPKEFVEDMAVQTKLNFIVNTVNNHLNNGSIKLDGVSTEDYTRNCLRGSIGMVLQDTWLFKGTIKDNLLYGDENATDEDIKKACDEAHISHFIETLPGGYDFMLNEDGNNVSQGQRQLLTIARAIISKPKILILDEATSSVDTRTEQQIQDALDNIMKNRTSFVIAHRLSTIKNAKLIIVMKKGHIVETGNHKELLAKNGFYAELYNSQFTGSNPMAKAGEKEDS
ncbi:MAG: ABC transporter transmembrane domain-containing protein [Bacilli bacterium]